MTSNDLHVHIGEVKIGTEGDTLHALLGSCIGIGFLYPETNHYGLAHCLLADSQKTKHTIGGRHVDQAVFSLCKLMKIDKVNVKKVRAVIVGGGNMTKPSDANSGRLVGSINADFAKKKLREERIKIIHEDLGGMFGRKIEIDCSTGKFTVNRIPRLGDN